MSVQVSKSVVRDAHRKFCTLQKRVLCARSASEERVGHGEVGTWDHPQGTVYIAVASWACL